MACKYIFNKITYSSKEEFIKEVLEKDFINQPKTLRVQEIQQPDFLKNIRNDKNYLKTLGLSEEQQSFLNLLFGDNEKWVRFFISSLIQNAAKSGYSKVWLPSGNTSAKVEGHSTLEEFKKQKEDRIKEIDKKIKEGRYDEFVNVFGSNTENVVESEKDDLIREKKQLKQELERVEKEGFGALKPIYNFYENVVANILKKQGYNPILITDEYGNTWNEIDLSVVKEEVVSLLPQTEDPLITLCKKYNMDANNYVFNKGQNIHDINRDLKKIDPNYLAKYIPNTNMIALYKKLNNNKLKRLRPNINNVTTVPTNQQQALVLTKQNPLPSDTFVETLEYPISDIDRTSNVIVVDGEVRSYFDFFDELVPTADIPINQTIKSQINILDTRRRKLIKDKKFSDNSEDIAQINNQIAAINAEIRGLKERSQNLENLPKETGSVSSIFKQAEEDLNKASSILSKEDPSPSEIKEARNYIDLWVKATAIYDQDKNIIFDDIELQTEGIRQEILNLSDKVRSLDKELIKRDIETTVDFVNSTRNRKITIEELMAPQKDIAEVQKWLLNPSRSGNPILQSVYEAVTIANNNAYIEARERWKSIDDAFNKAKEVMSAKEIFNLFRQQYKDGTYTSNATFRFTQEYFDTKESLLNNARRYSSVANSPQEVKVAKGLWKKYYDWANDNQITFDARILFPDEGEGIPEEFIYSRIQYDPSIKKDHLEKLKRHLGEKGLELYINTLQSRLEEFKEERLAVYTNLLNGEEELSEDNKILFEIWLRENSPYWAMDIQDNEAMRVFANKPLKKSFKYTVVVPRRFDSKGNNLGWYDTKFERIESNEKLLDFYNIMLSVLMENKSIIGDRADHLSMNTLPFLKKSILEAFEGKAFSGVSAFKDTWNRVIEMTRESDSSIYDFDTKNVRTGETQKEIQIPLITSQEARINADYKIKLIKFKADNPDVKITKEIKDSIRKQVVNEIAQESSFDLVKILKLYSFQALSYKHKSFIEDSVDIATKVIQNIEKVKTNDFGIGKKSINTGESSTDGTLKNAVDSLNNFLDNQYYGYKNKDKGFQIKKVLSSEEKKELKDLKETLEKTQNPEDREIIQKKIDSLGGIITSTTVSDTLLKYFYLVKLGWNVTSAISNTFIGLSSNTILASDPRDFKKGTLFKAYTMALNSIGSNYSFDLYKQLSPTARKIRNIMDKLNVLNDGSRELYNKGQQSFFNKNLKRFMPFNLQQRSEYLNQSPIMIAYLLSQEVSDSEGNKTNLWEALDEEGNLKEGYSVQEIFLDKDGNFNEGKLALKIESLIHEAHGDYKNKVKATTTAAGRLLLTFRRFMLEGFANRVQKEWYDPIRGYNRKGRYRTGIGVFSYAKETGLNSIQQTLFNSYQLLRKIAFQKTQYDNEGKFLGKTYQFNPEDAANMRKNITELLIFMSAMGTVLLLSSLKGDEDDEETWITNYLINYGNRLITDLSFYINPREFERLNKNTIPLFVLYSDSEKWIKAVQKQVDLDESNDAVQSGTFEGMNWLLRRSLENIPVTAQGMRVYNMGDRVLGEK